jgi:hypothetical protein
VETPCGQECEAGWCPRHRMRKSDHWRTLCRAQPAYFAAWERGEGPGQSPPNTSRVDTAKINRVRRAWHEGLVRQRWTEGVHRPWPQVLSILDAITARGCWPGGCNSSVDDWATDVLWPDRWRAEWGTRPA